MPEKIITDNPEELIKIKWDGVRFALIRRREGETSIILLNSKEMLDLVHFAGNLGGEKHC